jgi:hypothetical protein
VKRKKTKKKTKQVHLLRFNENRDVTAAESKGKDKPTLEPKAVRPNIECGCTKKRSTSDKWPTSGVGELKKRRRPS